MPVARFEMPDGRIGRFEVPEGTSPEQAQALIQESLSPQTDQPKEQPQNVLMPGSIAQQVVTGIAPDVIEGGLTGLALGTRKVYGGLRQTGLELGERLGWNAPGAEQRFTSEFDKTQEEIGSFNKRPMAQASQNVGDVAGQVALAFALPGGPAKFLPSLAYTSAVGGGLSAAQYISEEKRPSVDRWDEFKKGAALAGGIRSVVGGVQALPRALNRIATSKAGQEGQALEEATGVPLTIGQKAGHETLTEIERGALGGEKGAQIIDRQLVAAEKYMEDVVSGFSKQANSPKLTELAGKGLLHAVSQAKAKIDRIRSVTSSRAYGDFNRAVGSEPVIPVENFSKTIAELSDIAAPATIEAKAASQSVQKTLEAQLERGGGKITADQLLSWQQKINKELFQNLDRQGKAFAQKRLMEALNSDVNDYSGNAAELLKKATRTYARGSEQLRKIEDTAVGRFLGKELDPFKAAEKYTKLSPPEIRQLNGILRSQSGALEDMQANVVMSAIQKASQHPERLAGKSQFSPNEFIASFPSRQHFDATFSDSEIKKKAVMKGIEVMQRVADKNAQGAQGIGVRQSFADFLGNVAGGNPIFIARMSGKIFGPIGLRWALFSKEGQRTIQMLAMAKPNTAAYANAVQKLADNSDVVKTLEMTE